VEEVIIQVFNLLRDSKDETHIKLMLEISEFFQAYCKGNGDNQAIMANHIKDLMKMEVGMSTAGNFPGDS
jgi:hypothetical protein